MNHKRHKSEEKFSALLELIADPVVIINRMGTLLEVNHGFEKVTRLSREEALGKNVMEFGFFSEKIRAIFRENLKKRREGLEVKPYEVNIIVENGETVNFEVNAKNIEYCGQPAVLAVLRLVARRKRVEKQLEEYSEKLKALVDEKVQEIGANREKMEKILESSPDAIAVASVDAKISECNQAALDMFVYSSKNEVIGRNLLEFVAVKDQQKVARDFQEIIVNKETVKNIEYRFVAKDGREIRVEISSSLINYQGKPAILSIARDITERKELQSQLAEYSRGLERLVEQRTAELRQAQAKLIQSERLAAIGELAGMVGHDLRNPLTAVKNAPLIS